MKKFYIITFLILFSFKCAWSTRHNIANSGFTFSPAVLNAHVNDTVDFTLSSIHTVIEVSQATWDANGNTSNGGFTFASTGMLVLTQAKTYYYVCGNHFSMGMKGTIVVTAATNGINITKASSFQILPNPAISHVVIQSNISNGIENQLAIFDINGKTVYAKKNISVNENIDVTNFPAGVYFVAFNSGNLLVQKKLIISKP